MLQKISGSMKFPQWAQNPLSRWRCFDIYDKLLAGKFYDHLPYAFYDEVVPGSDKLVELSQRRPNAQYRLPRMVARWSARKLWAGRHAPQVKHTNPEAEKLIRKLLANACFFPMMLDATIRGSVGSVAVTFRVDVPDQGDPQVKLNVWRARDCKPTMDRMGNLARLQVAYTTTGASFLAIGGTVDMHGLPLSAEKQYWFIRQFTPDEEITFLPPESEEWNPETGFSKDGESLKPWADDDFTVKHDLGFVPGVWIRNLAGGCEPDGACTWEDAIGFSIELDYLLSQAGRGVRYNCAPELVIVGEFAGGQGNTENGKLNVRSAAHYIHLRGAVKDPEGISDGGGSAELLEMSGQGTEAAIKLMAQFRNMALEAVSAARKDPEKLKAPLSGRAMEFLDEDTHDLVMELRAQYGEYGALVLVRKIVRAAYENMDESLITLQWPRLYQATPDDVQALLPSIVQAVTPIADPSTEVPATKPGPDGSGGSPGSPPKTIGSVMELREGQDYIRSMLDLEMWAGSEEADPSESPRPDAGGSPGEPTPDNGEGDEVVEVLTPTYRIRRRHG